MGKPKIRFKGYTTDWEQRKFADFTWDAGKRNKEDLDLEPYAITNEHGFIRQCDAHDDFGYMKDTDRKAYNIVQPNSFAYNPARINVGSIGYYKGVENVIVSSLYEVFQTDNYVNDRFLWHWLKSDEFPRWIERLQEGSVRLYFYYDKLCECQLYMPSLEEQEKIASFLDALDHLITLHQRKYEEMKTLKRYMLQKMFPQSEQKVPEIRFAGFTEDWEQRKVLDLLELLTDYDANGSFADMAKNVNTTDGDGYAWYVRITDLENPKPLSELKYVDESSYKFLKKTELHGGELLMAKRGDIGKVYIFEPRTKYATVAPNMYLLKLNDKVIPHFLYDYFVSEEGNKKLTRLNASSTMGALYKDDVKNIDVIMPSIEEQDMIGNFFQSIDRLITLHQHKCEELKNIKKFMLQNMFV